MKKKLTALALIAALMLSLLTGCGGGAGSRTMKLSPENTEITTSDGITVNVGDYVLDGEAELVVTKQPVEENEEEGYKIEAYDISIGEMKELGDFITIRIPYDKSYCEEGQNPARCVGAKYKNEETGEWEDVLYEVDEEAGELVIYTDHLSYYGAFYVKNEGKRSAYITDVLDYAAYMDKNKMLNFSRAIAEGKPGVTRELAQFGSEFYGKAFDYSDRLDNAINIATLGSPPSYLSPEIPDTNISMFTAIGYAATCYNLMHVTIAGTLGDGPKKDEVLNLIRDVSAKSTAYWGKAFTSLGEGAMSVGMGGVLVIEKMLTAFAEEAKATKLEDINYIYHHFNEEFKGFGHTPMRNKDWREKIIKVVEKYPNDAELAIKALEAGFNAYASKFFELSLEQMNEVATDTPNVTMKRVPAFTESEKNELIEDYVTYLKDNVMPAVLKSVEVYMVKKTELIQLKALNKVKDYYNKEISITIKEKLNEGKLSEYDGYKLRFAPLSKEANEKDWTGEWNEKGVINTSATLLGFMISGYPHTIEFYAPDADIKTAEPKFVVPFVISIPEIKIEFGGVPTFDELVGKYKNGSFTLTDYFISDSLRKSMKDGGAKSEEIGCDLATMLSELDSNLGVPQEAPITVKKTGENEGKILFDKNTANVKYNPDTGLLHFVLKTDESAMEGDIKASYSSDKKRVQLEGDLKTTIVFFKAEDFYCNIKLKGSKKLKE